MKEIRQMIKSSDIFRKDNMLCIAIASSSMEVRGADFTRERTPAMLYKNGTFVDVPWFGLRLINDKRCLCFDEKPFEAANEQQLLIPSSELSLSLRNKSFELLYNLASALDLIDKNPSLKNFLDWNFYSLPLSSFYFLPDNSVFLLPQKASDLIDSLTTDEDRFSDREAWYVHEQANDFGKANFLFQLLYYSLTGIKPYGLKDVRNTGFKPVPVSLYFKNNQGKLPAECEQLLRDIEQVFKLKRKDMYRVSNPYEYFKESLKVAMEKSSPSSYLQTNSIVCEDYLLKLNKKANRNIFLRKKGTVLAAIAVAVIVVIAIVWYYIALAIAPPQTAGYTKEEIVRTYYQALNDLDITNLEDSLARGCKSPDSQEITTLYVSTKTRQAYENLNVLMNPQQWLDEGKPALVTGGMVYGVTNINLEELSEDTVRATFDYYLPYDEEENEEENEGKSESQDYDPYEEATSTLIAKYKKVVDFTFVTNKTWLEISGIKEVECTLQEIYEVPYKEKDSSESTILLTNSIF